MRIEQEIKEIIEELSKKNRFSDLNREKLMNCFSAAELNCNHELYPYRYHLSEIKRKQRDEDWRKSRDFRFSRRLRYLVAPALAAMAIFITIFALEPFRTEKTGDEESKFFAAAEDFSGSVSFERGKERGPVNSASRLTEGDFLITGKASHADISLGSDLKFRLAERSRLRFRKISSTGGMKKFSLDLAKGELLLNVKKLHRGDAINIYSPSSVATVKGTLFGVRVDAGSNSLIEVYEGKVKVRNSLPPGSDKLDAGTRMELEKILEEKAVVVKKGSTCSVKRYGKRVDPAKTEDLRKELALVQSPAVRENKPGEFKMTGSMFSFIEKHEGEVKSEEIRKYIRKFQVKKEKPVAKKRGTAGFARWKKKNRALYLIYARASGIFLSVNGNGRVEAIDLKQVKWSLTLPGNIESRPVVDGKKLFFSTRGDILGAVDLTKGRLLWSKKINGHLQKNVRIITDGTSLYAATSSGYLYKYTKDGKEIWARSFEDALETTPVLGMHMVLVSLKGGRLYGIDRNRGIKIIKKKFESKIVSMVIHKSNVYIISDMGNLICYNYLVDEFLWSRNFKSDVLSEMLVEGRYIYIFTTGGIIYKIDGTGRSIWKSSIGNRIARNAISDRVNIYLTVDNAFYVVNKETGDVKWSVVTPSVISGNLAVSGEKVVFVTDKNGLTELKK
jgi:outer membrane protein assembly factor BamB